MHRPVNGYDHAYEELLSLLPGEEVVNVDETGHKQKGRRLWTWYKIAFIFGNIWHS